MRPTSSLRERLATLEDLQDLVRIEQSAFPPERCASEETLKRRMKLHSNGTWIGLSNGEPAAFANGFPIGDCSTQEELDPANEVLYDPKGEVWLLRNLAVHLSLQRRGLGNLLISRQLQLARNYGAKSFRFTATSDLENYYYNLGFRMIKEPASFHGLPQGVWNLDF